MDRISEICARRELTLIEDCAQAIGARFHGRSVGTFGIGCFSLHPLKVLAATGDAGFVTLADDDAAVRLRQMRNIGLVDRDHCAIVAPNSRLDTIQAAMLLVKLEHLGAWIAARRAHADAYREALSGRVVLPPADAGCVYSAFVIRVPRRDALIAHLRARGIDARVHYPIPIHRQEAFAALGATALPVTDRVVSEIVSLPCSPELEPAQRERVIAAVREWCG
jgi:dTDP-4-amino-4,6-dideoxygalactose transaminase